MIEMISFMVIIIKIDIFFINFKHACHTNVKEQRHLLEHRIGIYRFTCRKAVRFWFQVFVYHILLEDSDQLLQVCL